MSQSAVLVIIVVTFFLIVTILVTVLVGSTMLGRRRYLRTREHLGGRLLTAQDAERAAIARDLHDGVVQDLIASTIRLRGNCPPAAEAIADEFDAVIDELRDIARGMHPVLVEHVGLDAALRDLCSRFSEREEIRVEYAGTNAADTLQPRERLALYRVAQEALGNIARHAKVDRATVTFSVGDGVARLVVEDAGAGFDAKKASRGPGIGVTSMQERLSLLGGSLKIESALGEGTRVVAELKGRAEE